MHSFFRSPFRGWICRLRGFPATSRPTSSTRGPIREHSPWKGAGLIPRAGRSPASGRCGGKRLGIAARRRSGTDKGSVIGKQWRRLWMEFLGGYGHVNDADIKGSEAFLKQLLAERFPGGGTRQQEEQLVALDCGASIGRITKNLLISYFNEVDLLEPVSHFLEAARESLASESFPSENKTANFFCSPLQEFSPDVGRYNVIWIQWCICHLADDDFVAFFKRAKVGLKPGGFFFLKENIARDAFVLDKEDRSVTRSDLYFKDLFNQCGLHLCRLKEQRGLPEELFTLKMYALTPRTCLKDTELAQ